MQLNTFIAKDAYSYLSVVGRENESGSLLFDDVRGYGIAVRYGDGKALHEEENESDRKEKKSPNAEPKF